MRSKLIVLSAFLGLVVLGSLAGGCGTTDVTEFGGSDRLAGAAPTTSSYLTAQGIPGDLWRWTVNRGVTPITVSATNLTPNPDLTYSGTAEQLTSGWLKITITTTNDPAITTPHVVYAVEFPGIGFIVQTSGASGHGGVGLAEVTSNPCPAVGSKFNWVDLQDSLGVAYGISTTTATSPTYSFGHEFFDFSRTSVGTDSSTGLACSNGLLTAGTSSVQISDAGLFILDDGPGSGAVAGSVQGAVTLADLLAAGKEFRGLLEESGGTATQIWAGATGSDIEAGFYFDVDTNQELPTAAIFTFDPVDAAQPGVLTGTADVGGTIYDFVAVARQITAFGTTKYVIFGKMQSGVAEVEPFYLIEGGTPGTTVTPE